jgi:hypothetical protein
MAEPSLTTLLQQRANRRPGGTAYTFIDYEDDPAGVAERRSTTLQIVDPGSSNENPAGKVGELWRHGENVAREYWQPQESERTFVDGSNHYPDDIEAIMQEITGHKVDGFGHKVQIRNGGFLVCGRESTITEPLLASLLQERANRPEVIS